MIQRLAPTTTARGRPGGRILGVGLALTLVVAACGSPGDDDAADDPFDDDEAAEPAPDDDALRLGLLVTLEGTFATLGIEGFRGAKLALQEYGGELEGTGDMDPVVGTTVGGREVEVHYESSDTTPEDAIEKARSLVEGVGVDVLVGPLSGDEGVAMRDYSKTVPDKTIVNSISMAAETTLEEPSETFFRYNWDAGQWQGGIDGLGKYVYEELGYERIAALGMDYAFGHTVNGTFLLSYCAAGGELVDQVWAPLGTTDFAAHIEQLPDAEEVDAIFLGQGGSDVVSFVRQYDDLTGFEVPVIGGAIAITGEVLEELGPRVEGMTGTSPAPATLDTPEWEEFADRYRETFPDGFPTPSEWAAVMYYNTKAVLQALDAVDGDLSDDHEAFRQELATHTVDGPVGEVQLDHNRQGILPTHIVQVVEQDGELTTEVVQRIEDVDQSLGLDEEVYTELEPYTRDGADRVAQDCDDLDL